MKYLYGPVHSWRLGNSLGIDLLSGEDKICSFNCEYCQVGSQSHHVVTRGTYVPTSSIIKELKSLPNVAIDYITFSGRGEPTLAKNLGEAIKAVKELRKEPVAVLTNSSLMYRKDVRSELSLADLVACKLDADSDETFAVINSPARDGTFVNLLKGIKDFRKVYKGKLALQIMFVKENMRKASKIAELAKSINPDEVQINTPLRPSLQKALSESEISKIKKAFKNFRVISVYDKPLEKITPIDQEETLKRRGEM